MELSRRQELMWAAAAFVFIAAVLIVRLWGFGIWDPWELNAADQARDLLAGRESTVARPPLQSWLVALGFATFGVQEWAGRLPLVVSGLGTVAIAWAMLRRFAGSRAGIYAALVVGTTPLFLFNARQMLGEAPAFAAQALTAWAAMEAVLGSRAGKSRERWTSSMLWTGLALLGALLSVLASGALAGPLPPLVAVVAVAALRGHHLRPRENPQQAAALYAMGIAAAALTALVVMAVLADHAEYSPWLGGKPRGGAPPTFEVAIERVFHAFAPWSALLPLAIGRMLLPSAAIPSGTDAEAKHATEGAAPPSGEGSRDREGNTRLVLVLWASLAYGAMTLFTARYGSGTYVAVVALAGAVALLLRDVERSRTGWWASGIVGLLLVGLLVRDFGLYPGSPVGGLGIDDLTVPEVFNPKTAWAAMMMLFGAGLLASFVGAPGHTPLDLKAPYRLIRTQWGTTLGAKVWLCAIAGLALLLVAFGVVSFLAADAIGLTTLVRKWGIRLAFLPIVVPVLAVGGQVALKLTSMLGRYRMIPVLLAGAIVGAWAAQGFLPALSSHFSPREVYDTFNNLADDDAVLGEFRVGGRAAAYYAHGEIRDIETQPELIEFLSEEGRRWAAFPSDELPAINRAYRRRNEQHLFVADARSARVVLATNQPLEGIDNQNFVAEFVRDMPPEHIEQATGARFEDKIELLGFDLNLPHGTHVGAGESFEIIWYYRVLGPVPGSYKVFVHIDGMGNRLNGDHDPIEGRYPVRLWDEGDIVVDRQELSVPANYRPGPYTIFLGFFAGNSRLEIEEGPKDDEGRVRAGILQVR